MLDQPLGLWRRVRRAATLYYAVKRWRTVKGEAIHDLDPALTRTVQWLIDEGYL